MPFKSLKQQRVRKNANLKAIHKVCRYCGKELVLRSHRDIERKNYCSHACRQRYRFEHEGWSMEKVQNHRYHPPTGVRICQLCGEEYTPTAWKQKYCIKCVAPGTSRNRYSRYGITQRDYDRMILDQKGQCAICDKEVDRLNVDHSHKTGKVRGLLCTQCNFRLFVVEDYEWMEKAKLYLLGYEEVKEDVPVSLTQANGVHADQSPADSSPLDSGGQGSPSSGDPTKA